MSGRAPKTAKPRQDYEQRQIDKQVGASSWQKTLIEARENCRDALNQCTMDPNVGKDQTVKVSESQQALHGWVVDFHRHVEPWSDNHPLVRPIWYAEDYDNPESDKERYMPAGTAKIPQPRDADAVKTVNYLHEAADETGVLPTVSEAEDVTSETVRLCDIPKWRNREITWTEPVYARRGRDGMVEYQFREPVYLPVDVCEGMFEQLNKCVDLLGFGAQPAEIEVDVAEPPGQRNHLD